MLAAGKRGVAYLLNSAHLGGIGGQLAQAPLCLAFSGMAVQGTMVYVPCITGGMAAVNTSGKAIRVRWRGPGAAGSPVLGGGAVWVAAVTAGILCELDPVTGQVRHQIKVGSAMPHFASPSLSGRLALIGTMNGVVAVSVA
jgi:polyvinyl alcohol dehydrogenase (cytochrome)